MSIPLETVYFVHIAVVLCDITRVSNTCKISGQYRVMFTKVIAFKSYHYQTGYLANNYDCVYRFCRSYMYIKNSNGPKFAEPSMDDHRPLLKTSLT